MAEQQKSLFSFTPASSAPSTFSFNAPADGQAGGVFGAKSAGFGSSTTQSTANPFAPGLNGQTSTQFGGGNQNAATNNSSSFLSSVPVASETKQQTSLFGSLSSTSKPENISQPAIGGSFSPSEAIPTPSFSFGAQVSAPLQSTPTSTATTGLQPTNNLAKPSSFGSVNSTPSSGINLGKFPPSIMATPASNVTSTPAPNKPPLFFGSAGSTTPAGAPPSVGGFSVGAAPSGQITSGGSDFTLPAAQTSTSLADLNKPTFSFPKQSASAQPAGSLFNNFTAKSNAENKADASTTSAPAVSKFPLVSANAPNLTGSTTSLFPSPATFGSGASQPQPSGVPGGATTTPSAPTNKQAINFPSFGTTQSTEAARPAGPAFSLKSLATTNESSTSTSSIAPGLNVAAAAPSTTPGFNGIFAAPKAELSSMTQPIAAATNSISSAAGTTGITATAAAPSSSITGPIPAPQSRLKNRSMDDIITRWATDLAKYQKEFQQQAQKIATWDRLLVENSDKISRLYSRTYQAERDAAEVDRQLSAVENQQNELSAWLDRYEHEVDEMIGSHTGGDNTVHGPDEERERTYKMAEKISERLGEMSSDLTLVIEELNEISANLSKSKKTDDPLSQIVKILNSHLSQLQLIDQGATALQEKVLATKEESQRLGASNYGILSSDSAADFFRSYAGGR